MCCVCSPTHSVIWTCECVLNVSECMCVFACLSQFWVVTDPLSPLCNQEVSDRVKGEGAKGISVETEKKNTTCILTLSLSLLLFYSLPLFLVKTINMVFCLPLSCFFLFSFFFISLPLFLLSLLWSGICQLYIPAECVWEGSTGTSLCVWIWILYNI